MVDLDRLDRRPRPAGGSKGTDDAGGGGADASLGYRGHLSEGRRTPEELFQRRQAFVPLRDGARGGRPSVVFFPRHVGLFGVSRGGLQTLLQTLNVGIRDLDVAFPLPNRDGYLKK